MTAAREREIEAEAVLLLVLLIFRDRILACLHANEKDPTYKESSMT